MPSTRPIRVHAMNVTPASRTPWGGRTIVALYKDALVPLLPDAPASAPWDQQPFAARRIGESWEFSLDPERPSICDASGEAVHARIAADPVTWLGPVIGAHAEQSSLQVKIIDAADNLSLQVHPRWAPASANPHETGKFETWVVLQADDDAAIYLGVRRGVTREHLQDAIARGENVHTLLHRVPVQPGDTFHVRGGTPHAIGKGVVLLEPQAIPPGGTPQTFRFWDWNRRYDAEGELAPDGAPRPLAIEASLATIDWAASARAHFVETCRAHPETLILFSGGKVIEVAETAWYTVERVVGHGEVSLPPRPTLTVAVCLHGRAAIRSDVGTLSLERGQTGVFPAVAGRLEFAVSDNADVYVVRERSEWVPRTSAAQSNSVKGSSR